MNKKETECCYDKETLGNLRILYLLAIMTWLVIVNACGITRKITVISMSIVLFPIALMAIAAISLHKITKEVERCNNQTNYISLGLIVAVPLLSWIKAQKESEHRNYEQTSMILFVLLIMITPMDVWVAEREQAYVIHIKSISQILLLAILVSMLVNYFSDTVSIK